MEYNPDQLHQLARAAAHRQKGILVLENVEAKEAYKIFELADTFGFQFVYLVFNKVKKYDPLKIVGKKDFSNAARWLDFNFFTGIDKCIDKLKSEEYRIVGPIFGKGVTDIYSATFKEKKMAVLIGGKEGLSDEAELYLDTKVIVPKHGATETLPPHMLAGVLLYEINRQRELYGMDKYLLPIEKEDELRRGFSKR